jgi:hypothetical protein
LWHATALGSASLLLTPPFVGYLDNVLCLVFLAASLYFIPGTRDSWPARAGFFLMLLGAGFTHPTTLAIFCLVLGAMAVVKLLYRRFDLRSVIADDGPMLVTAFVAGVVMVAVWTIGIWGKSASLSESALSPPYGSDFFVDRLVQWIETMRPVFNAPLLLIGIVGLLATSGRRPAEDELTRVSIVWLAPLVGIFGFLAGAAYPYYRFFNTTLSWVLLVGIGMFFAVRVFIEVARRGGAGRLALLGVAAIAAIIAMNFVKGFDVSGWNKATGGWLPSSQKIQLDNLRTVLADFKGRPVVFVIDDEPARDFQIWGFTKLSGNTSRYGMPEGEVEKAYMYLGDLDNYLAGEPTLRGEETYDLLSPALLEDLQDGVAAFGEDPVVVVAEAFNPAGANVELVAGESPGDIGDAEIWVVDREGRISQYEPGPEPTVLEVTDDSPDASAMTAITSFLGMLVLLAAGALGLRFFVRDAELPDALGMVPALSMAVLSLLGMVVLAVIRSPLSPGVAWACAIIAIAVSAYLRVRSGRTPAAAGRR